MTGWLWVWSPVQATSLCGVFLPLTYADTCEKSSRWLWKEKLCFYCYEKARKHMCVADRHDMTLAVKVALNPNTTNQPFFGIKVIFRGQISRSLFLFKEMAIRKALIFYTHSLFLFSIPVQHRGHAAQTSAPIYHRQTTKLVDTSKIALVPRTANILFTSFLHNPSF